VIVVCLCCHSATTNSKDAPQVVVFGNLHERGNMSFGAPDWAMARDDNPGKPMATSRLQNIKILFRADCELRR
jgi:hypothetical protein